MKLRNKIILGILGGVLLTSSVATAVLTASCGSNSSKPSTNKPSNNVPKVTLNQDAVVALIKKSTGVDDFATLTVGQMVNKINDQTNNKAIVDALKQNANKEINNASDKLSESNLVVIASSSNNDVSVQIQGIPQTDNNLVNLSLTLTGFKAWKQTSLNKDEFVNIVKEKTSVTDFTMVTSMQMLTKINDAKATIISALTSNENGVIVNPTESLSSATIELTATDLSDSIDITISGVPALSEDGTDTTIQLDAVLNGFKKWTNTSLNQEAVTNLIKDKTGITLFSTVTANQMINKINSVKDAILTDLKANKNGEIVNPGKDLASSTLTLDATSNEQTVNIVIGSVPTDLEDGSASTVNLKLSLNGFKPWAATSLDNIKMIQTIQTATEVSDFSKWTAADFKNKMVESNEAIVNAIKANSNFAILNPGPTLSEATTITITPTVSNQTVQVAIAGIPTLLEDGNYGTCELSLILEGFKAWAPASLNEQPVIKLIQDSTGYSSFNAVSKFNMADAINEPTNKQKIIDGLKANANNEISNASAALATATSLTVAATIDGDNVIFSVTGIPQTSATGEAVTTSSQLTLTGFKKAEETVLDATSIYSVLNTITKPKTVPELKTMTADLTTTITGLNPLFANIANLELTQTGNTMSISFKIAKQANIVFSNNESVNLSYDPNTMTVKVSNLECLIVISLVDLWESTNAWVQKNCSQTNFWPQKDAMVNHIVEFLGQDNVTSTWNASLAIMGGVEGQIFVGVSLKENVTLKFLNSDDEVKYRTRASYKDSSLSMSGFALPN